MEISFWHIRYKIIADRQKVRWSSLNHCYILINKPNIPFALQAQGILREKVGANEALAKFIVNFFSCEWSKTFKGKLKWARTQ